jgi:hypothetical protein
MTKLLVGLGKVHQGNKTESVEIINLELISKQTRNDLEFISNRSRNNLELISNRSRINFESNNVECKHLPNFPNVAEGPIGGLDLQGRPIICGGDQKVHLLKNSLFENSSFKYFFRSKIV